MTQRMEGKTKDPVPSWFVDIIDRTRRVGSAAQQYVSACSHITKRLDTLLELITRLRYLRQDNGDMGVLEELGSTVRTRLCMRHVDQLELVRMDILETSLAFDNISSRMERLTAENRKCMERIAGKDLSRSPDGVSHTPAFILERTETVQTLVALDVDNRKEWLRYGEVGDAQPPLLNRTLRLDCYHSLEQWQGIVERWKLLQTKFTQHMSGNPIETEPAADS